MKRIVKRFLLAEIAVIALGALLYLAVGKEIRLSASAPDGYLEFNQSNTPGINIIDADGKNSAGDYVELSGDYGTMFKLTENVSYQAVGAEVLPAQGSSDTYYSEVYRFNSSTSGEKSVLVKNAGIYNGNSIDLKFVIDEINVSDSKYFNFLAVDYRDKNKTTDIPGPISGSGTKNWGLFFLFCGSTGKSGMGLNDRYDIDENVSYHYEFYDSATGQAINFKGIWNFNNINGLKAVSIPYTATDFADLYVRNSTTVGLKKNYQANQPATNYVELYGSGASTASDASKVSQKISAKSIGMNMQRRRLETSSSTAATAMGIMYDETSVMRIAPSTPIVFGERNSAGHDDPANYLTLRYNILQTVAKNSDNQRSTAFRIETEVPNYYDIDLSQVKVVEYGTTVDVTDRFDIAYKGSDKSKLVVTANDPTGENFEGTVYYVQVAAKPNDSFDFAANSTLYNYVNDELDPENNGYLTKIELGGVKTAAYYSFAAANINDQRLESEKISGQSQSQVRYDGVPTGTAKEDLTVGIGQTLAGAYPNAGDMLKNGWDSAVDTDNDIDRPITAAYSTTLPDISGASVGDTYTIPITLTSAAGVTTEVTAKVRVVAVAVDLTVNFVDEGDNLLAVVTVPSEVNETVKLSTNTEIQNKLKELLGQGYTVKESPANDEIVITYPTTSVTYRLEGHLRLVSVPAVINFDSLTFNAKDQRVDAPVYDEDLVVGDSRAVKTKWQVSATVTTPMTHTAKGNELSDALHYVSGGHDYTLSTAAAVIVYTDKGGDTSVNISNTWGDQKTTDGVKLVVAAEDMIVGDYVGEILWKLEAVL